MFLCRLGSRRQIGHRLNTARVAAYLSRIASQPRNRKLHTTRKAHQVIRWVNDIAYGKRTLHVLECVDTPKDGSKPTRWLWVTNIPITPENAISLANEGGRQRWRTENEGFNVQKNGGYAMEHAYAENPTAARNFYLLLQIAHLFAQLFEAHLGGKKDVTLECGSLHNLADDLLEALRTDPSPPMKTSRPSSTPPSRSASTSTAREARPGVFRPVRRRLPCSQLP